MTDVLFLEKLKGKLEKKVVIISQDIFYVERSIRNKIKFSFFKSCLISISIRKKQKKLKEKKERNLFVRKKAKKRSSGKL